ncbi:MAG: hypothetical protein LQ340_006804 [Diploschistes diacapsis]|nr:MAG: hypothetical protein LQ340_006804 [Diploschistes diacapsis]
MRLLVGGQQFGLFDLDKDKRLDFHELKVAMRALGFELAKAELVDILRTHGVPVDGGNPTAANANPALSSAAAAATRNAGHGHDLTALRLPLAQFQALVAARILQRDPREEILRAFELFDEGGKGRIDLQDLRRVARELGEGLGEEELAAMIEEFDLDGDGAIDCEEFLAICMQ